jgi:hypothetical protein
MYITHLLFFVMAEKDDKETDVRAIKIKKRN